MALSYFAQALEGRKNKEKLLRVKRSTTKANSQKASLKIDSYVPNITEVVVSDNLMKVQESSFLLNNRIVKLLFRVIENSVIRHRFPTSKTELLEDRDEGLQK